MGKKGDCPSNRHPLNRHKHRIPAILLLLPCSFKYISSRFPWYYVSSTPLFIPFNLNFTRIVLPLTLSPPRFLSLSLCIHCSRHLVCITFLSLLFACLCLCEIQCLRHISHTYNDNDFIKWQKWSTIQHSHNEIGSSRGNDWESHKERAETNKKNNSKKKQQQQ